jgi:cytochrome c2
LKQFLLLVALGLAVSAASAKDKPADPAKGKEVVAQCTPCHSIDSADKKIGPGLKGLFQKPRMQNGKKPTEQNVRARIDSGGGGMPAFKELLSDQEKNDLIGYLKTL